MVNYNEIPELESTNPIENRIIDAFMTLYADNPIEKISIKTITDLAGLNRGTFYLHYLDIYDLHEKIESKYHNISKYIASYSIDALFNNKNLEDALPSSEFYASNLKYYKILLCMNRKSNLEQIIKNELKEAIQSKYQISYDNDSELNAYALEYITSALVATIIHWIQNDMVIPLKDISKLIQSLVTDGALKYLERSSMHSDLADQI